MPWLVPPTITAVLMVGAIAILADFFLRFTFWGAGSRRSNRAPK